MRARFEYWDDARFEYWDDAHAHADRDAAHHTPGLATKTPRKRGQFKSKRRENCSQQITVVRSIKGKKTIDYVFRLYSLEITNQIDNRLALGKLYWGKISRQQWCIVIKVELLEIRIMNSLFVVWSWTRRLSEPFLSEKPTWRKLWKTWFWIRRTLLASQTLSWNLESISMSISIDILFLVCINMFLLSFLCCQQHSAIDSI